jgi:type I restriction enzyme S subunit
MRETLVKAEEFKDSPLGKIPKDWKIGKLSDVAINHDGKRIPLKQSDRDKMDGIYPYYGASGVIDWVDSYLFEGDYVLLGEDGENVVSRQLPLAFRASGKFWVNNHAHIYEPLPNVDIRFLTILLEYTDYSPLISGSAQPKLTQEALNRLYLRLPPPEEQKSIADILDTVNETITHTSSLIAKLKQMKAGLLHDLLTRGLDENGELRDAITHPEQFKDSPLGRIPKDWEVDKFEKLAEAIDPQPNHRAPPEVNNGEPYIGVGDFRADGSIDFNGCRKVSSAAVTKQQQRFSIEPGDIIFGKIGTIGLPKFLTQIGRRYALNANTVLIKPREGASFVMWLLKSNLVEQQIQFETHSTSQPAFGILRIRAMLVPIPKPEEQRRIAAVLDVHDSRIRTEEAYRDKLKLQKQGLMHDLLTGIIRVKDT